MKNQIIASALTITGLLAGAATAHAEGEKLHVSGGLQAATLGNLSVDAGGLSGDADLTTGFGAGVDVSYDVMPFLRIGFAPRALFGFKTEVNGQESDESLTEYDLRVKVEGFKEVAPKVTAFGYIAPGYSILTSSEDTEGDDPAGMVLGFGAGANYAVSPKFFVGGEVGYQLGFQSVSEGGQTADIQTKFLTIGINAGTSF